MDFLMTWLICVSGHIKFIKKNGTRENTHFVKKKIIGKQLLPNSKF